VFAAVAAEIELAKLAKTLLDVAVTCPELASLEASETTDLTWIGSQSAKPSWTL
jgi:hypothetical protein